MQQLAESGPTAKRPTRPVLPEVILRFDVRAYSAPTLGPGASLAIGERRFECTD